MNNKSNKKSTTVRNLIIFSVVILSIGWIGRWIDVQMGNPSTMGLGITFWISTPLVVSLLLRLVAGDGWRDFGIKPNFKGNAFGYIFSILAYPVVTGAILMAGKVLGWISFPDTAIRTVWMVLQVSAVSFLPQFIKNIFEELPWRGYLAPRMYSLGMNDFVAHFLVGLIWGLWHVPYYLFFLDRSFLQIFTTLNLSTFIPLVVFVMICWAVVYGEILLMTKSFWPSVLMHAIEDAILVPIFVKNLIQIKPGMDWLISPMSGLVCALLFLVIGIGLRQLRIKKTAQKNLQNAA